MSETSKDFLLLKWGSLKSWDVSSNPKAIRLVEKWIKHSVNYSSIEHLNNEEQRDILCDLIRAHTGKIQDDWGGRVFTKEEAIEYIKNYYKEDA